MTVAPMGTGDIIIIGQLGTDSGSNGFFASI